MSKIALVSGGNRGIGKEIVRQLAEQGLTVYLGSRSLAAGQEAAEELKGLSGTIVPLKFDVTNEDDVKAAAHTIAEREGKLDILINNAGAIFDEGGFFTNTALTVSKEVLRKTFEVNVFAQIHITQVLVPLLKKSEDGRIINMSSVLGSLTVNAQPGEMAGVKPVAYNASKAALNMFSVALANALAETNIKVNSAHPGWVKTDMGTDAAPMGVVQGAKTAVDLALNAEVPQGGFVHLGETLPW